METLQIVQNLRQLAADPANRVTIVHDKGCLPGLVLFLDNSNASVIETALEALEYLASCEENRVVMAKEMGLMPSLAALTSREVPSSEAAMTLASKITDILEEAKQQRRRSKRQQQMRANENSHKESNERVEPGSPSFYLGAGSKRARTVTLSVEGLSGKANKRKVEESLLRLKGVISFTFDTHRAPARVFVRCRTDLLVDRICRAISSASSTFVPKHVIKNDKGEEILVDVLGSKIGSSKGSGSKEKETEGQEGTSSGGYLPEEEAHDGPTVSKHALARTKAASQDEGGWFGSIGSYISKTLYW